MGVKLYDGREVDLRWWWEREPAVPGEALRFGDPAAARRFLAVMASSPDRRAALRRLCQEGSPGRWAAPDDDDMIDRLSRALAAGRIKAARIERAALTSFADKDEAAPVSAAVPVAEIAAPVEEVCWPCLRAAASARALREASADGAPFVLQG